MLPKIRTRPGRKGAALVEYVVLMGLLAVVAIFSIVQLGAGIRTVFDDSTTTVASEIETATGITITVPGDGGGTPDDGGFTNPNFYSIAETLSSSSPTVPLDSLQYNNTPPGVQDGLAYAQYWTTQATWAITFTGGNLGDYPAFTLNSSNGVLSFAPTPSWPTWCDNPAGSPNTPQAPAFVTIEGTDAGGNAREIVYTLVTVETIC
jgi:Flp pilus assembly pilin Flp